jgi:hypothetical protein
MSNKVTAPNIDASVIYEGGDITKITAEELKGNIVGIRQLINSHNLVASESKSKDETIVDLKSENEYLKTAPYVSIIAAIMNLVGSLIIGISTEMMGNELQTETKDISNKTIALVLVGILLVLVGSLATIFYPYARGWFNRIVRKKE